MPVEKRDQVAEMVAAMRPLIEERIMKAVGEQLEIALRTYLASRDQLDLGDGLNEVCIIHGATYSEPVQIIYNTMKDMGRPVAPRVVGDVIGEGRIPKVHNRVRQVLHRHRGKLFEQIERGRWTVVKEAVD